jgi:hypothetical protein
MLQITADMFSGRPNPTWIVADEQEARSVLKELADRRSLLAETAPADLGLGFRGLEVEILNDELAQDTGLPNRSYIAKRAQGAPATMGALVERLVGLISRAGPALPSTEGTLAADESLTSFIAQQFAQVSRTTQSDVVQEERVSEQAVAPAVTCQIEVAPYNPGFWNNDPVTRANNNCYNYASNKRTNTFAQPGRGCGHIYTAISCPEMTRASLCDGLHRRFDCFPDSEKPRYLVALVVAPGPGFIDFHWYRKMKEGFWGHKPGSTPVRNVDNSNKVIFDPATCDRGPYTQFCGYFYTCKSQKIQ